MPTINDAISAYKTTAHRATALGNEPESDGAQGPSFGSMVKSAIAGAVEAGKQSEAVSSAAIVGKADMTEVAQAVNNADITLQSVVAIRDKVVSAYQQIMNMPIYGFSPMNEIDVFDVLREAVIATLVTAGPVMAVGLVVGLVVSLFQALTQIQEATLSFVPKILAIFAALLVFGPFMLTTLIGFTHGMADRIVALH